MISHHNAEAQSTYAIEALTMLFQELDIDYKNSTNTEVKNTIYYLRSKISMILDEINDFNNMPPLLPKRSL